MSEEEGPSGAGVEMREEGPAAGAAAGAAAAADDDDDPGAADAAAEVREDAGGGASRRSCEKICKGMRLREEVQGEAEAGRCAMRG
jgi:hypothetical protein